MVKETYTKPEFDFQEMALFERVANVCWGTAQVWLDANGDGSISNVDIQLNTGGGCKGSWSADAMNGEISRLNAVLAEFNNSAHNYAILGQYSGALQSWAENSQCTYISPITATPSSNWANTQQTSGGGIIIIGS